MKNLEIIRILNNIANILELKGVEFKPRAYRNAARGIEELTEDIAEVYKRGELKNIPGVGEHIALKIEEIIKTGKLRYYEQLKKEVKINFEELTLIPSLGPKKIKLLYQKLKIKNIKDIEEAIKKGKLEKLKGFGEETVKNLKEGIELAKSKPKRVLYAQAKPIVEEVKKWLSLSPFVERIEIAGSYARGKETVGDLDFLVVSNQPVEVIKRFTALPDVKKVLAKGTTKGSVLLNSGMQLDLRVVKEKEFGSAMLYFIGNKKHNIELRKIALKKGYTLSEYGLFTLKGKKFMLGKTQEEIYQKLGLQYIEPELRHGEDEFDAAKKRKLPQLITIKDIKGVFHLHSKWTDGVNSLLEMAQKAEEAKLKFISFNDHCGNMGITNSIDEKRLSKYLAEIEQVRKKVGIRVYSGLEIDIMTDGRLPLPVKRLKELDVVITAVHLALRMSEEKMTNRVCAALENYPINILGHPTDRLLNERSPLNLNLEKVFETAKRNNVFMEINSFPKRMDLSGENIHAALAKGCKLALGVDAHDINGIMNYPLGVNMARRGGAEKKDILNCWSLQKIENVLKK